MRYFDKLRQDRIGMGITRMALFLVSALAWVVGIDVF